MPTHRITAHTLHGWGAVARAAKLMPFARMTETAADISSMTKFLLYEAKCHPQYSSRRLAEAIARQAGALRFGLSDKNVWARVLAKFVKRDAAAAACLLTALGSLLRDSPFLGANAGQRQAATAEFLGQLLFAYKEDIISDVVNHRSEPADPILISIFTTRAKSDRESVARVLELGKLDTAFVQALQSTLEG
jgi:hypothetical protein